MHTKALSSVIFVVAYFACGVYSNPDGAPSSSCSDMIPRHGRESSTNPFETITSASQVAQGDTLTVTLRTASGSSVSYKGYLTMAFDASKPNDNTPIGTFSTPSNGQTLNCLNLSKSAITHTNNNNKQSTTATYTAPADFVGSIIFKTTYVENKDVYVLGVSSAVNVTAVKDLPTNYRVEDRA